MRKRNWDYRTEIGEPGVKTIPSALSPPAGCVIMLPVSISRISRYWLAHGSTYRILNLSLFCSDPRNLSAEEFHEINVDYVVSSRKKNGARGIFVFPPRHRVKVLKNDHQSMHAFILNQG